MKRHKVQHRSGGTAELHPGYKVMCRWRDGKYRKVKIIERRLKDTLGPQPTTSTAEIDEDQLQYYVHYLECRTPSVVNTKT